MENNLQEQSSRFAAIQGSFNNQANLTKRTETPEPKLVPGNYSVTVNKDMTLVVKTPNGNFTYSCYKYSPSIKKI